MILNYPAQLSNFNLALIVSPISSKFHHFSVSLFNFVYLFSTPTSLYLSSITYISPSNIMTHPHEEMRAMKEHKAHADRLFHVCDAQYGIPDRCPCGGSIIHEVDLKPDERREFDTFPGKRYFTCKNYVDDGLHFRQPWVFGVQEEIEKVLSRMEEMESEIEKLKAKLRHLGTV